MANIKSNIKSIRKNKKRSIQNKHQISKMKSTIKKARLNPTEQNVNDVYKIVDSSLAKGKIHKNKANRIKSRIAKKLKKTKTTETVKAKKEEDKK